MTCMRWQKKTDAGSLGTSWFLGVVSYAELVQQLHYDPKEADAVKPHTVMTVPFVSL
eukprot:SAG31_NODE_42337_length_272_cov_0.595376_1_plen_56_part_10